MIEHEIPRRVFQEAIDKGILKLREVAANRMLCSAYEAEIIHDVTIEALEAVGMTADRALVGVTRIGGCGCPMAKIGQAYQPWLADFASSFDSYLFKYLNCGLYSQERREGFRVLIND